MALQSGFPVFLLQDTVVSRWFVTPRTCDGVERTRENEFTNDFDTFFGPASSFESLDCFFDTLVRVLLDFRCVVIMPSARRVSDPARSPENETRYLPWVGVVLRELKLVLGNNVRVLVKDDESHRAIPSEG